MGKSEADKTFFLKEWLVQNKQYNSSLISYDFPIKELKGRRADLLFYKDKNNRLSSLFFLLEIKDGASYKDDNWWDAYKQAYEKAISLNLPIFGVVSLWENPEDHNFWIFNTKNQSQITFNKKNIFKIPEYDLLNSIYIKILNNKEQNNFNIDNYLIRHKIDSSRFDDLLINLKNKYRHLFISDEKDETQPIIDLSISLFVSKIFYEINLHNTNLEFNWNTVRNNQIISDLKNIFNEVLSSFAEDGYTDKDLDAIFKSAEKILADNKSKKDIIFQIYNLINNFGSFRNIDIDIYGSIYEMFASKQVKSSFGKYFTKRNYTEFFANILINNININNIDSYFKILDPFCGTGGFLSEIFKSLNNKLPEKKDIIKNIIYGWDKSKKSISLTKINMYIIGDGHNKIQDRDSLEFIKEEENSFDLIITNPPYGKGVIYWESSNIKTQWMEKVALKNIVKWLKPGGIASVLLPLSFMENEKDVEIRKWFLSKVNLKYVFQMNEFAFSPYTKTETLNLIFIKKTSFNDSTKNVYMYKIYFDGFYNSDKRFKTSVKDEKNMPIHNELTRWNNLKNKIENSFAENASIKQKDIKDFEYYDLQWNKQKDKFKAKNINILEIEKNEYKLVPNGYLNKQKPKKINNDSGKILDKISFEISSNENRFNSNDIQKDGFKKISELFKCEKRSDVLTEEFIYSQGKKLLNEKSSLKILSANTSGNFYGEIPLSIKDEKHPLLTQGKYKMTPINWWKGKGLHVPTAGQVGYVKALLKDDYYATTTAARIIRFNNEMKEYYENYNMLNEAYKFYEKEISQLINLHKKDSKRGGISISTFMKDIKCKIPLLISNKRNRKVLQEVIKNDKKLLKIKEILNEK